MLTAPWLIINASYTTSELGRMSRRDPLTLFYGTPRRDEHIVVSASRDDHVTFHRLTYGASDLDAARHTSIAFALVGISLIGAFAIFALVQNLSIETLALWGFATVYGADYDFVVRQDWPGAIWLL